MVSNYCPVCQRYDFHWGGCADQNALLDYEYGKHPIPYSDVIKLFPLVFRKPL